MSWQRYPNANYPTPWDEADMAKATDVSVNVDGGGLTVTAVGAGEGPLHITAADVPNRSEDPVAVVVEEDE
jgi:hypothetical protein